MYAVLMNKENSNYNIDYNKVNEVRTLCYKQIVYGKLIVVNIFFQIEPRNANKVDDTIFAI